jgi:small subunit ribosomal protein S9
MPDDETNNETSEPRDEAADSAEPAAEVAADNAAAESADPGADEQPPAEEPAAEEAPAEPVAEAPAEESPAAEEEPAEEPVAEEAAAEEEPAEEEAPAPRRSEPAAEKKDVIPGADLEPIAVEPTGPALSAEEKARLEAEEEEKARREAARLAAEEESDTASRAPAKMEAGARFLATGKRKCSIARVTLLPGDGKIEINKRSLEEFFPRPLHQTMAVQPLTVSGYEGNVDVRVRVHGGGISGQAGAVRHGIARALIEIDSELRSDLKRRGFLTRDARVKERRKAGFKKARKKPQFSKR